MSSYRRYNYRAYPTQGQREALSCLYGACRYAYNWTLDQRELMRRRHGRMQSCTQLSNMFTLWKREPGMEWLLAVSSTPLQQSIRHADMAYRNFLRLYKAGRTHIVTNRRTGKKRRTGAAPVQEPQGRGAVGRVHQVRAIQGRACGRMQVGVPHAPENRAGQAPLDSRTAVQAEHRHHHEACGRLLRGELHRASR